MGLLKRGDWGEARWIEYPDREAGDPLPLFARPFEIEQRRTGRVVRARLYLSGVGLHLARLNGKAVTDEVLAPGNSNYQLSTEYRVYDVTRLVRPGANTVGVELGHGTALVSRSVTNPATGRTAPYSWWQSQVKGSGTLSAPAAAFGGGPHFGGGTIGLAPTVRALTSAGRDDVLWKVLQEDTRPSYGYFMAPTTANPGGLTTIPEQWDMGNSKNHVILLQIEEWFHGALAGIRQAPGSVAYRDLVFDPRVVGGLTHAEGSYRTPYGEARSAWTLRGGTFRLTVTVPPNTTAEVRLPEAGRGPYESPAGATPRHAGGDRPVFTVPSGTYGFTVRNMPAAP
ncbi:alpha-L-rhamnosidase N-terminal domain-containing protein [Streptomyces sp. NPDC058595]|uniref:alpha-L-rhamnosidase N-terminal domain-containing protein n=1 Tax=Streptomyces sp. NPDC058595 TaxID=3346550 RepID=UPI0036672388